MGKRITIYLDDEMVKAYDKLNATLGGQITVIRYLLDYCKYFKEVVDAIKRDSLPQ